MVCLVALCATSACKKNSEAERGVAPVEPAKGDGENTVPRVEPEPGRPNAPVETGKPNVPEFKPAFAEQTRAPATETKTPLAVQTVAKGLNRP